MRTLTLDFDGSVLSTSRHAQGTSVGFNRQKKGARGDYPLFCHVAQTGQVLDVHHRSGNIHDSNGAVNFTSGSRCYETLGFMLESIWGYASEKLIESGERETFRQATAQVLAFIIRNVGAPNMIPLSEKR